MSDNKIHPLMQRRFLAVANDTSNFFDAGDIFIQYISNYSIWRKVKDNDWTLITISNPEKYPHLFRELKWYEQRSVEEMPEYVKGNLYGMKFGVFKLSEIKIHNVANALPATLDEYNEYLNKQI